MLDPEGWFQRLTGFAPQTCYNKRLATGFTLGLAQELKVLQAMIRAADSQLVARLARHWSRTAPDLVVSLVPNFNRAMARALKAHDPAVPFVTVMTDLADLPPYFWIEPGHTQHLVCGTDHAVQQALQQGLAPTQVHRVSAMILRPAFNEPPGFDRERVRQELGFAPGSAVGIVMFGGHGWSAMKRIAASLADQPLNPAVRPQCEPGPSADAAAGTRAAPGGGLHGGRGAGCAWPITSSASEVPARSAKPCTAACR